MEDRTERTITLKLTNEDAKAFFEKCYKDGTTPAEVLGGFINDLVCGMYTHGSDERDLANEYYDRCGYNTFLKAETDTFAQWLVYTFELDEVEGDLTDLEIFRDQLDYAKDHPDEVDEEDMNDLKEELANCERDLESFFQEYRKSKRHNMDTLEEALNGVREYLKIRNKIAEGGAV